MLKLTVGAVKRFGVKINIQAKSMIYSESDDGSIALSVIVCDLGATKIRVGSQRGGNSDFAQCATPEDRFEIYSCIERLVNAEYKKCFPKPGFLVVGCPGLVDEKGFVHKALYINLSGVDLKSELERRLKLRVLVLNDAKLQASGLLGEFSDFVYFSLGSGVGGAVAVNHKLVYGVRGFAGELGHFPLRAVHLRCRCGKVGCLDTLAGGISIANRHGKSWWNNLDSPHRAKVVRSAGVACGRAASTLLQILNPSLLFFCGRLTDNMDFMEAVNLQLKAEAWGDLPEIIYRSDSWGLILRGAIHVLKCTGDEA